MATKLQDLNPNFIKKLEDLYGPIHPQDSISDDLMTYLKVDLTIPPSESGALTQKVINLPSFKTLYQSLGKSRQIAKSLRADPSLRKDKVFQDRANQITDTFNDFRTFFRTYYPDQYNMVKGLVKEMSTSGAAGAYNTPFAFKKKGSKPNISSYTSIGYEPVDRKALRKKAKGIDYIDLYKD
jgi:hypothetical protein